MTSTSSTIILHEMRYPKRKCAKVQYYDVDAESDASTSEEDCIPIKRPRAQQNRPTKPRPKNKIFPFLKLPAELRNRIYKECLPKPTKMEKQYEAENKPAIWFNFTRRQYRRTVEYVPSIKGNPEYCEFMATPQLQASQESGPDSEKMHCLNLLAVCKQLYDEVAPMFYTQHFIFTDTDALFAFASNLSPRTAKLLRHIEVRAWGLNRSRKTRGYSAMAMLAAKGVTGLESLHINCKIAYFHSNSWGRKGRGEVTAPRKLARKVYRDCGQWLEAVGSASGDWFKGVDVVKINKQELFHICNAEMVEHKDNDEWEANIMKMYRKELVRLMGLGAS